jgi:undecaprenyl-diphosphatase
MVAWGLRVQPVGSGSGLYDGVIRFAGELPSWLRGIGALYTQVGLLVFVALFAFAWWQARSGSAALMASALLAPLGTAAAYLLSEVLKTFIHEERPCRSLAEAATVLKCPEVGDWSFPSNHSTIAASAAVGLILYRRKFAPWLATLAVLMAFSRVFVGAHYPHDVAVGLALGAAVAWLVARLATTRATTLVTSLRRDPRLALVLGAPADLAPPAAHPETDDELTLVIPRRRPTSEQATVQLPVQPRTRPAPPRRPAAPRRPYPEQRQQPARRMPPPPRRDGR